MDPNPVKPPPGFVLDQAPAAPAADVIPKPPPGFMLDAPSAPAAEPVNPNPAIEFGKNLLGHPIDEIKAFLKQLVTPIPELARADVAARQQVQETAADRFAQGSPIAGVTHSLYGSIPLLGPALSKAGEQFESGNFAGGAGSSVRMGLNLAAPSVLKNVKIALPEAVTSRLGAAGERLYQSALKPATTTAPGRVASMVQTGTREGVPVSETGLEKIGGLVTDLNQKITDQIAASGPKRTISPGTAVENLKDVRQRFATQVNPSADLSAIDAAQQDFLDQLRSKPGGAVRNLTAEQAQAMKQGTYQTLGKRAYGELKGATVEAQKALARGLKDELVAQFPELASLNAREGSLLQLEPALTRAVARISNQQLVGIGTPLVFSAGRVITGSAPVGAVAGIMKAVLDNPVVKSRVAIAISKARNVPFPASAAKVAAYANLLGSAADAEASPPDGGQATQ